MNKNNENIKRHTVIKEKNIKGGSRDPKLKKKLKKMGGPWGDPGGDPGGGVMVERTFFFYTPNFPLALEEFPRLAIR